MNTTIKALQDLYVKLGGSLTDTYETIASGEKVGNYTTIPDMIEAVTQKAESGGGGGAISALRTTLTEGDDDTWVSDKTPEEIYEAWANGAIVNTAIAEEGYVFTLYNANKNDISGEITLEYASVSFPEVTINLMYRTENDWTISYQENTLLLPEVSASDNGKILKVIEGSWAVVLP